jgi:DNA-directed RNA polymerase subunit RPC12/RpoP
MKLEIKLIGTSRETNIYSCNMCGSRIETSSKKIDYKYCPYCGKKVGEEYDN